MQFLRSFVYKLQLTPVAVEPLQSLVPVMFLTTAEVSCLPTRHRKVSRHKCQRHVFSHSEICEIGTYAGETVAKMVPTLNLTAASEPAQLNDNK